jgi:hypothetical protein
VRRLRHLQIVSSTLVSTVLLRPLLCLVKVCWYILEEGEGDDLVDHICLHLHLHLLHLIPDHVNSLNQIHHRLDVTTIRQSLNRRYFIAHGESFIICGRSKNINNCSEYNEIENIQPPIKKEPTISVLLTIMELTIYFSNFRGQSLHLCFEQKQPHLKRGKKTKQEHSIKATPKHVYTLSF